MTASGSIAKERGPSPDPAADYRRLMRRKTIRKLSIENSLNHLADLIDTSFDANERDGLVHAIKLAEQLCGRRLKEKQLVLLHYFLGNAWSNLRHIDKAGTPESWNWEQNEIEHEITHFRLALTNPGFMECDEYRRCQILTNLGNLMNHVGRFVEAQEYLSKVLEIMPTFGMGLGSRGSALSDYARSIPRQHDAILILDESERMLSDAIRSRMIHAPARAYYAEQLRLVQQLQERNRKAKHRFTFFKSSGASKKEREYRYWCLRHRLFLNYLNDITDDKVAAGDNVILPSLTRPVGEGLHFEGLYNQLKQEFVSARYVYFEAIRSSTPHFSDKRVVLFDTMDCPSYSLAVEKVKTGYRVAYSLLDKIGFFLNAYLELGIEERRVTFRTVWYTDNQKKRGLRAEFTQRRNWALRGLFWLSKDVFEDTIGFREAIEPDAKELKRVRDHIEHKYLKVLEFDQPPFMKDSVRDRLALTIARQDLHRRTLTILKLTRAALMYLTVAVHWEEMERNKKRPVGRIARLPLETVRDQWKL